MAFLIFAEEAVDRVVLEVGLGGRLDATNVVRPLLAVITPIDFDHESNLGRGIESIAAEKAGILKSGVPAVFASSAGSRERAGTHTGRPLGSPGFVRQLEITLRRRLTPEKGGRRPKQSLSTAQQAFAFRQD